MGGRLSWDFLVLNCLRDAKPVNLKSIYLEIANLPGIIGMEYVVDSQLYDVNLLFGDRPKYTHVIRATMSNLLKQGMVEHCGRGRTGVYQISPSGLKQLEKVEP